MSTKGYALAGMVVGAVVNVLLSLLAAAIQQRTFANQFSAQSIWWLVGFILGGLLVGYWVGTRQEQRTASSGSPGQIEAQRLKARGDVEVVGQRGKDMRVTDVEAGEDISLRDEMVQPDPDPKGDPPE